MAVREGRCEAVDQIFFRHFAIAQVPWFVVARALLVENAERCAKIDQVGVAVFAGAVRVMRRFEWQINGFIGAERGFGGGQKDALARAGHGIMLIQKTDADHHEHVRLQLHNARAFQAPFKSRAAGHVVKMHVFLH